MISPPFGSPTRTLFSLVLVLGLWTLPQAVHALTFPVLGGGSFSDDFGDPRSGGRTHEGNDVFAAKHTPLLAVTSGTVQYIPYPEPEYGYGIFLNGDDGYSYRYLHVNNDTPGTDDGLGGGMHAYAPYMVRSAEVKEGQLVGYVGDSGNAESTSSHLHFEKRESGGGAVNPYTDLRAAFVSTQIETTPVQDFEIAPFAEFAVDTSLAVCHNSLTDTEYLVVGAAEQAGPQVQVYELPARDLVTSFFAYDTGFRGGVDVACGDTDGNGVDEIITGAGPGGGPHVRLFSLRGRERGGFFVYEPDFRGGLNVAAADLNGKGRSAVIVAPLAGRRPQISIYTGSGRLVRSFLAYDKTWTSGVDVAAVSASNEQLSRIVTAPAAGGGPQVRLFTARGRHRRDIWPYDIGFRGGVRVASADASNRRDARLLVAPATGGGPDFRSYDLNGRALSATSAFENWWRGGYDVAISDDYLWYGSRSGQRRASVQWDRRQGE